MRGYPQFFFLASNSFCKDLLFPHGANLVQKPPYLVGTVLNLGYGQPSFKESLNLSFPTVHFNIFKTAVFQCDFAWF